MCLNLYCLYYKFHYAIVGFSLLLLFLAIIENWRIKRTIFFQHLLFTVFNHCLSIFLKCARINLILRRGQCKKSLYLISGWVFFWNISRFLHTYIFLSGNLYRIFFHAFIILSFELNYFIYIFMFLMLTLLFYFVI